MYWSFHNYNAKPTGAATFIIDFAANAIINKINIP